MSDSRSHTTPVGRAVLVVVTVLWEQRENLYSRVVRIQQASVYKADGTVTAVLLS